MAKSRKYLVIVFSILICIFAAVALGGCITEKIHSQDVNKIIDSYGREVSLSRDVQRIATVGSATRFVVYAGAQDKLVAITEMDRPSELRPYTIAYEEEFKNLPTTNNGNQLNSITVDEEKLIALDPDVIISTRSADECNELQQHTKIPVIGLNPTGNLLDDEITNCIQTVGLATNTSEKANELLGYLRGALNTLLMRQRPASPNVYRGALNYRGSKDLTGTYSHYDVYDTIKIKNVADNPHIDGPYDTSLEQILEWNPEYVFMDYSNKNKVIDQMNEHPEVFSQIQAFQNNKVYFCAPFNNNGINFEYAICECYMTAKIVYPEVYSDINLEQKFQDIIANILHKDIYPQLVARGVYYGPAQF